MINAQNVNMIQVKEEKTMNIEDIMTKKPEDMTNEEALLYIAELERRIEATEKPAPVVKVAKNHRMGKVAADRKYVLLSSKLAMWGKVPQQQSDIAELLLKYMTVDKEYTEGEVFNCLIDGCGEFNSLCTSKQDPTYLFRYYRGLKNDGKHAGFIARGFLRQIN